MVVAAADDLGDVSLHLQCGVEMNFMQLHGVAEIDVRTSDLNDSLAAFNEASVCNQLIHYK